jgi:hypothetical protein
MTLSNLSIYVVFVDPYQGINDVTPISSTTKAYVKLIGVEKTSTIMNCKHAFSCIIKSNNGSKKVKSYNQIKLCMCMEYGGYMICVYGG